MPLPLVGGTIWTGMGPQEEARLLVPTAGVLPQPRSMPGEVGTQCQDGRVARPYRKEKGSKDLTYHPVLRRPGSGLTLQLRDGCLQEPSQRSPFCTSPPTAPATPT
ncbi:dexamethasone-induced protein isoform X2 [Microtus ochrogaster]|uniref:Dexamethasone-induced protein isoform X2 n=1 Tax=Microtus ochrogaster TaxID=79684 RepID=A0ABM1AJ96_MICOH|nr:dexamethasone-induced protein isoform X2 [Microtus ochrogaster]